MEPTEMFKCSKCGEDWEFLVGDDLCSDCWPGYNLCKACEDYRCEHIIPTLEDLEDAEFFSCPCGNLECRTGFIEGSTNRIITRAEFNALKESWRINASN